LSEKIFHAIRLYALPLAVAVPLKDDLLWACILCAPTPPPHF